MCPKATRQNVVDILIRLIYYDPITPWLHILEIPDVVTVFTECWVNVGPPSSTLSGPTLLYTIYYYIQVVYKSTRSKNWVGGVNPK